MPARVLDLDLVEVGGLADLDEDFPEVRVAHPQERRHHLVAPEERVEVEQPGVGFVDG